jgi:hypothetical protein
LTPQPDGITSVDVVVVREGKNLKGRLIAGLLTVVGARALAKGLEQTVRAIETRNNAGQ